MVGGGGGKGMEGNTEVGERREGDVLGGFTGETWVSLSSSWRVMHLDLSALPAMAVSQGLHCPPGVYGSASVGHSDDIFHPRTLWARGSQ